MYNNRGLLNYTNNIHHHRSDDLRYYYGQNKTKLKSTFFDYVNFLHISYYEQCRSTAMEAVSPNSSR